MNIKALEKEMKLRGLSINELSKISGIDKSTISRILSNERNCSINTAQQLAKSMNLSARKAAKIFFEL